MTVVLLEHKLTVDRVSAVLSEGGDSIARAYLTVALTSQGDLFCLCSLGLLIHLQQKEQGAKILDKLIYYS